MKSVLARALRSAAPHRISAQLRGFDRQFCWTLLLLLCLLTSPGYTPIRLSRSELTQRIQSIIATFGSRLGLAPRVMVVIVPKNPRLISVQYASGRTGLFEMSFEEGFLPTLDDTELRAAVAHEMGHIWIYTHFPFLQTEILANRQARKLVARSDLAKVYKKVWAWNGEKGDLMAVLGPEEGGGGRRAVSVAATVADSSTNPVAVESLARGGPRVYVETAAELHSSTGISGASVSGVTPALSPDLADSLRRTCPGCIVAASKERADYFVTLRAEMPRAGLKQWSWAVYDKSGRILDKGATSIARNSAQRAFRALLAHWRRSDRVVSNHRRHK